MQDEEQKTVDGDADSDKEKDQDSEELDNRLSELDQEDEPGDEDKDTEDDTEGDETKTPELKYTEESLQHAVSKAETEWQSRKDKEFDPLYADNQTLKKKVSELESQIDDKAGEDAFAYLKEEESEDKAAKFKKDLDRIMGRHKELKHLEELNGSLPSIVSGLEKREKVVQSRDFGYEYFPEVAPDVLTDAIKILKTDDGNSKLVDQLRASVRFIKARKGFINEMIESESDSSKDLKMLARARSSEIKGRVKGTTHKPDSGRTAGGGYDPRKLTGDEKVAKGLLEASKKIK